MRPFDYFASQGGAADWLPVPDSARHSFPPVEAIVRNRVTRHTGPF